MDPHRHRHRLFVFSLVAQRSGDPYGIRTRVAGVRGRSLRPLDQRALFTRSRSNGSFRGPRKAEPVPGERFLGMTKNFVFQRSERPSGVHGAENEVLSGTPSGTRTLDTLIKSQVL